MTHCISRIPSQTKIVSSLARLEDHWNVNPRVMGSLPQHSLIFHINLLIPHHIPWLTSKKKEWRGPKLIKHFTRSEVDERYKVTSGGARTCLVPNNQVQACVVVTSRVESTVLHYPCNVYPRVVASNPAWDCTEISKPKNHTVRLNTIINHKYILRSSLLL